MWGDGGVQHGEAQGKWQAEVDEKSKRDQVCTGPSAGGGSPGEQEPRPKQAAMKQHEGPTREQVLNHNLITGAMRELCSPLPLQRL